MSIGVKVDIDCSMTCLCFELLQIAIGNRAEFSRTPIESEWLGIYAWMQKQALTGIAFLGIEHLPKDQKPPRRLLLEWYVQTEQIKKRNAELETEALGVVNKILKDGFQSVVLKGHGIARLYPRGYYRISGDIDLWLSGQRCKIEKYVRELLPKCSFVYHNVAIHSKGHIELELHFTPSWMFGYFTNNSLQRFFKTHAVQLFDKVQKPTNYTELPIPSLGFNRIYILVHIYRHLFGEGIGLRQLMDYYYVLQQGFTEEERIETLRVLSSLNMLRFTKAVMYVLKTVFAMQDRFLLMEPDEKEGRFLLNEIMQAGNFGHYDTRIKRITNESSVHVFYRRVKRNFRFLRSYPSEVLWTPFFKIWHFCWRLYKNG